MTVRTVGRKLIRYSEPNDASPRVGCISDGEISPLLLGDIGAALTAQRNGTLAEALSGETIGMAGVEILAPLPKPGKIICIGLNYRDHAEEVGKPLPTSPVVFAKFNNTILGPSKSIVTGHLTSKLDYEAELGVVIGRHARNVSESSALRYVAGYVNVNDVTARDVQAEAGAGQWTLGKSIDTYAPIGPWLSTVELVEDPQQLDIVCAVNGVTVQESNTGQMIFGVAELIAFLSSYMTLEPGDLIATGTPAGVGTAKTPPVYLQPGDQVSMEVEGLGQLTNTIVK